MLNVDESLSVIVRVLLKNSQSVKPYMINKDINATDASVTPLPGPKYNPPI